MNNISFEIPVSILEESKRFFATQLIQLGEKSLRLSKVAISFEKGTPETYFIVAGLVKDDRSHESKISYKKRLEGTSESPLSSNCDCSNWTKEKHCQHAAALFLAYYLEQHYGKNSQNHFADQLGALPPITTGRALGVTPDEYGIIIESPSKLIGANTNSTYSTLYYVLHNKKVTHFPLPTEFPHTLKIIIQSSWDYSFDLRPLSRIRFSYEDNKGRIFDKISLFESIYIFNWETGEAFNLAKNLREIIQKIRINSINYNTNDFIDLYLNLRGNSPYNCKLIIDDQDFDKIQQIPTSMQVTLAPNDNKGNIKFSIQFHDLNNNLVPIPPFFTGLAFKGGLLGSQKKKKDVYDFLHALSHSIENRNEEFRKFLNSNESKMKWLSFIEVLNNRDFSLYYEIKSGQLFSYDNHLLKTTFKQIIVCFTENFFRFSTFDHEKQELQFILAPSLLFQGLTEFQRQVSPFGTMLYYDRNQIARWNNRIRFERRSSATKWFDLGLSLSETDLEIIRNADLQSGLALTNKGLVLIDREQKNLLRFMKRYIQLEEKKEEIIENPSEQESDIKKFILPMNRTRLFELFELKKLGIEGALTNEEIQLCEKLASLDSIPEYQISAPLNDILRPYQKTGHHWLRFLHENKLGACLADDMGLGKTLQAISFLKSLEKEISKVLIICPVTILLNWEKEIKKFSDLEVTIYHGGSRNLETNSKIILTSYGVMKKEHSTTFSGINFDILILDEVQHLKNIRSLGAYAARAIKADFRICLTGTPVENDLAEFYNIMDLCVPGIWGDIQMIRTISNSDTRLGARKTAAPFILRRTKSQVLSELPPKIDNTVVLTLDDIEQEHYNNILKNIRIKIQNAPSQKKYGEILKGLLELRQSCLWQKHSPNPENFKGIESTKIHFLLEQLEQILSEGHQALVFSQFTTYLDIIQNIMAEKHWKLARIDGQQLIKKRQEQVDLFQEGKAKVFLISLKAGGVGLNLTAASYVFIMDPWWNPAVESQAIDRAHRIGQKNTLTVYRPIIKGSVEEKVIELQEQKKQLFKDLLPENDDEYFTGKLSMKDFEHLFN